LGLFANRATQGSAKGGFYRDVRTFTLVLALASFGCAAGPVQGLAPPESGAQAPMTGVATATDYAPNVDVLALGYHDGSFEVRSPAPLHVLSRGRHEAPIVNVALSKDARKLATVDAAGHVAISTVEDGTLERLDDLDVASSAFIAGLPALGLSWDPSGKRLALASGKLVRVVDVEACTTTETKLPADATALAFSPDGRELVAAGSDVYFLSLPDLGVQKRLPAPRASTKAAGLVTDVRFSPDGRALGIVTLGGVAFLDVAASRLDFAELPRLKPVGLRFADDGRVAVFGRGAVYAGEPRLERMDEASHATRGKLTDVEFRRDGSLLVLGQGVEEELAALLEPAAASSE
jgi:WD40 repeat protein